MPKWPIRLIFIVMVLCPLLLRLFFMHGWPCIALGFLAAVGIVVWHILNPNTRYFKHKCLWVNAALGLGYVAMLGVIFSVHEMAKLMRVGTTVCFLSILVALAIWSFADWKVRNREQQQTG